jgi:DNA-binding response OmpR family regulator
MTNASPCPHVLAVDDDPQVRALLADYLGANEMRVTAVASGKELAATMARETVDLVVLDVRLHGEDGMQIARRLREESAIPILLLTGRAEEADRVMGLELGADDYLTKPFSTRELLARIRALLRRAQAQASVADAMARVRAYRFAGWELNVGLRRLKNPGRRRRRSHQRRVQLARRVPRSAAADADARPAARALAPAQRRGLRPLDRRPDPAPAQEDRGRPAHPRFIVTQRGAGYVFDTAVDTVR